MRFTFATFLLLSAFLEASAIRIPRPSIPKPNPPKPPNDPNTPSLPGRLPGPDTPNNPGRLPGDAVPCSGRRRGIACTIDTKKWDDLQIETKYRKPGADAIADLDSIKSHPGDAKPNTEDIDKKYFTDILNEEGLFGEIAHRFLLTNEDTISKQFVVKNQEEKVDELIKKIKDAGGDKRNLDHVGYDLKSGTILRTHSNPDRQVIVVEESFGQRYDVYRDYDKDGLERPALTGNPNDAIRWSDQVMDGWKKANHGSARRPLAHIIKNRIITEETNQVIEAAMQKAGLKFGGNKATNEDYVHFSREDENKEGFEAIAGTMHVQRVIQMLKDYHQDLHKTIDTIIVGRSPYSDPGSGESPQHDILIELVDM